MGQGQVIEEPRHAGAGAMCRTTGGCLPPIWRRSSKAACWHSSETGGHACSHRTIRCLCWGQAGLITAAAELADRWPDIEASERRTVLAAVIARIDLVDASMMIRIRPKQLATILTDQTDAQNCLPTAEETYKAITLSTPAHLERTGMEMRLLIDGDGSDARKSPDQGLLRVLALAHRYRAMALHHEGRTMAELAAAAGVIGSYFTRILRLSFLAPDTTQAILYGRHPVALTAKRLANEIRLHIAWNDQRTLLGFG